MTRGEKLFMRKVGGRQRLLSDQTVADNDVRPPFLLSTGRRGRPFCFYVDLLSARSSSLKPLTATVYRRRRPGYYATAMFFFAIARTTYIHTTMVKCRYGRHGHSV